MYKILACILILLFPLTVKAEWQFGVGAGLQYGGVVGLQAGYSFNSTKLHLSAGLVGLGLGIGQRLSENISIGYQGVAIAAIAGHGIFLNYTFTKAEKGSWVLGLDYLYLTETLLGRREGSNGIVLVSAGYQF